MLRFFRSSLALVWLLVPGCGLTLDYDPPEDGGADVGGFDGSRPDVPCGGCAAGLVCVDGACATPCSSADDCHLDDASCEVCDLGRGICAPFDGTCVGGCGETCNPLSDVCEPNCPTGQSCLMGMCSPEVACTTGGSECDAITNVCGEPATCVGGVCQDPPTPTCPTYDCGETDACNGCAVTARPELCVDATQPFCDVSLDRYRCVACLDASDCDASAPICDHALGLCRGCTAESDCAARTAPHCNLATGACVGCAEDGHCTDAARPVCDPVSQVCVTCTSALECPDGQVCRADRTCGTCATSAECGLRAVCVDGTCTPPTCGVDSDCPAAPCATARCTAGRCVYSPAAIASTLCNDGRSCTNDFCSPNDPRADANGCAHGLRGVSCDDSVGCTVDVCIGTRTADPTGCAHRPNPRDCSGDLTGDCTRPVCVPTGAFAGCHQQFLLDACAAGELCTADGACQPVAGCDGCTNDGVDCNGIETCVGGTCTQTFSSGSTCNGACNAFCISETQCGYIGGVPVACP